MITGVAIRWGHFMIALPRPARHNDVLRVAHERAMAEPGSEFATVWERGRSGRPQGFIDKRGRFLTREEAAEVALQAGQITVATDRLYSEDIW